jgi:proteasome accessory factor C
VTEYHPVETATEEPDGGLTITLRVGDPAWLTRLLLRLGGTATLVDPPELAQQVRDTALRALQHYA